MKKIIVLSTLTLLLFTILGCEKEDTPTLRKGKSNAIFNPNLKYGSVTDIDGNTYKTIKIGTQTWMAENLRVTHYQNGDSIPFDSISDWYDINKGIYCTPYNTTNVDTIATYGLLYNGFAIKDARKIAPKGWRIPTQADIEKLYEYLTSLETPEDKIRIGGRLKEVGTKHWCEPNIATNSSGFTLLPTPIRSGTKYNLNENRFAWLFTISYKKDEENEGESFKRFFVYGVLNMTDVKRIGYMSHYYGLPIRCIKEK